MRNAILAGLYGYNDQFAGPMENSMLTIGARDAERRIIGGLIANLQPGWKWMHLQRLWVEESHRRAGIGRLLVETAENTNLTRASRNLQGVKLVPTRDVSVYDLLKHQEVLLTEAAAQKLGEALAR